MNLFSSKSGRRLFVLVLLLAMLPGLHAQQRWAEGSGLTFWSSRPSGSTTSSTPTARPIAIRKRSSSAA